MGGDLVRQGGEDAVVGRAQPYPLQGGRAVTDDRRELAARQGQLDGPPGVPRGHRGQYGLRAGRPLAAETAADVLGDDGDLVLPEPEQGGEFVTYEGRALAGVVDGQVAVLPAGGGGVRFHRVVVQRGHGVRRVEGGGRGGERPSKSPRSLMAG